MASDGNPKERMLTIRFDSQGRGTRIAAWKYWEVVEILRWHNVGREEAYDAASWASRMRERGEYRDIPGVVLIVE